MIKINEHIIRYINKAFNNKSWCILTPLLLIVLFALISCSDIGVSSSDKASLVKNDTIVKKDTVYDTTYVPIVITKDTAVAGAILPDTVIVSTYQNIWLKGESTSLTPIRNFTGLYYVVIDTTQSPPIISLSLQIERASTSDQIDKPGIVQLGFNATNWNLSTSNLNLYNDYNTSPTNWSYISLNKPDYSSSYGYNTKSKIVFTNPLNTRKADHKYELNLTYYASNPSTDKYDQFDVRVNFVIKFTW